MKKNVIIIIIAVIVIALLGGAIVLVVNMNGDEAPPATSASDILIYDKTSLNAEEIYITTEYESYSFFGLSYADKSDEASIIKAEESSQNESSDSSEYNYRTETGFSAADIKVHYTMQEHPTLELDAGKMKDLAFQCSYLTASKIVDKSGKRYADFGLDKPFSTVKVIFSDNSVETIMIGNEAPDSKGVYFRREKSPNVYLAVTSTVDHLYQDMLFFFDRTITGDIYYPPDSAEGTSISSLLLKGEFYGEEVYFNNEGSIKYPVKYMMTKPYEEIVDAANIDSFGKAFYSLTADSVAAADPDEKTLAELGLDKPYIDVTVAATDESEYRLLISKEDDNGNIHIMNYGGKIVFNIASIKATGWYEIPKTYLYSRKIIQPDLLAMSGIDISHKGKTYHLDVVNTVKENEQGQELINTTISYKDTDIGFDELYNYLYALSNMYRVEYCDLKTDGMKPEYTAKISYKKGDQTAEDEFCIYRTKEGRCFVVLNGHTESYVNEGYVDNFLPQLYRLIAGESIEIVEYSDESSEADEESSSESKTDAEVESKTESE